MFFDTEQYNLTWLNHRHATHLKSVLLARFSTEPVVENAARIDGFGRGGHGNAGRRLPREISEFGASCSCLEAAPAERVLVMFG